MLVPLRVPQGPPWPGGSDEMTSTPGAATSGFCGSDGGGGRAEETLAGVSRDETAARVTASGASPGDDTDPSPKSSRWLPGAIGGITPAAAAPSIALTTMS